MKPKSSASRDDANRRLRPVSVPEQGGFLKMTIKRTIALIADEAQLLRDLYLQFGIPTDQLARRPEDLENFTRNWNVLSNRNDSPHEVLHYMMTRRKKGQWVRFDGKHEKMPIVLQARFSAEEWTILDQIYSDFQISSDRLTLDEDVCKKFAQEFSRRAGRIVPPLILSATMIHRRKLGELETLRPRTNQNDLGFRDIDEVAE
jgi:hypothetical protein